MWLGVARDRVVQFLGTAKSERAERGTRTRHDAGRRQRWSDGRARNLQASASEELGSARDIQECRFHVGSVGFGRATIQPAVKTARILWLVVAPFPYCTLFHRLTW